MYVLLRYMGPLVLTDKFFRIILFIDRVSSLDVRNC